MVIRVGIIDIGSNSIKLLISESVNTQEIRQVHFEIEEVRIGEGMTRSPPTIDTDAIAIGTQAVSRLYSIASKHNLNHVAIVATSAVRDAYNKQEFIDSIRSTTGLELRTLTGREEARLIGKGVVQDPSLSSLNDFSLADLGGGSLECIQFRDQIPLHFESFNLGAVRLTSEFIQDRAIPVSKSQRKSIRDAVRVTLQSSSIRTDPEIKTAVLTGGAASILAQLIPFSGGSKKIDFAAARSLRDQVCEFDFDERVSKLTIPEKRADIFPAATIILCELLEHLGCNTVYFSFYNLRFGLAAETTENYRLTNL